MAGVRTTWQTGQVHLTRATQEECLSFAQLAAEQGARAERVGDQAVARLYQEEGFRFLEGALQVGGMEVLVLVRPVDPEVAREAAAKGDPPPLPSAAVTSQVDRRIDGRPYRCPDTCACASIAAEGNSLALLRTVGTADAAGVDMAAAGLLPMAAPSHPWDPVTLRRTGPARPAPGDPIVDLKGKL